MTALIVIGAIALVIFILLASSIRVDVEYGEVFKYRVKYLFFTFVKNPLSPRELKRKEKKELKKKKKQEKAKKKQGAHLKTKADVQLQKTENAPQSKQEQTETEKKEQPTDKTKEAAPKKPKMKFSFDLIRRIIGRASPHVKRIFKKIRLSSVAIDITVGGDDAAKVAISYGVHCSTIHSLVALLDYAISFKADRISVRADFDLEKSEYYVKATLKLRLSTLFHSAIWGFFAVLSEIRKGGMTAEKSEPEQKKAA